MLFKLNQMPVITHSIPHPQLPLRTPVTTVSLFGLSRPLFLSELCIHTLPLVNVIWTCHCIWSPPPLPCTFGSFRLFLLRLPEMRQRDEGVWRWIVSFLNCGLIKWKIGAKGERGTVPNRQRWKLRKEFKIFRIIEREKKSAKLWYSLSSWAAIGVSEAQLRANPFHTLLCSSQLRIAWLGNLHSTATAISMPVFPHCLLSMAERSVKVHWLACFFGPPHRHII